MKKPTLKQLKKRPALWCRKDYSATVITYPNGTSEVFYSMDFDWLPSWHYHKWAIKHFKFLGWL